MLFFGGDFSGWVFPPGTHLMEGGVVTGQRGGLSGERSKKRSPGSASANEGGGPSTRRSRVDPVDRFRLRGRAKSELYVTELIADSGSHSFETRADTSGAYGFVGLTNFSIRQPYRGQLAAYDPRSGDAGSASRIKLPDIVLGPTGIFAAAAENSALHSDSVGAPGSRPCRRGVLLHCRADSRQLRRQHFEIPIQHA